MSKALDQESTVDPLREKAAARRPTPSAAKVPDAREAADTHLPLNLFEETNERLHQVSATLKDFGAQLNQLMLMLRTETAANQQRARASRRSTRMAAALMLVLVIATASLVVLTREPLRGWLNETASRLDARLSAWAERVRSARASPKPVAKEAAVTKSVEPVGAADPENRTIGRATRLGGVVPLTGPMTLPQSPEAGGLVVLGHEQEGARTTPTVGVWPSPMPPTAESQEPAAPPVRDPDHSRAAPNSGPRNRALRDATAVFHLMEEALRRAVQLLSAASQHPDDPPAS